MPASHGHLEAILKQPAGETKGSALVCHPHPLGGGTMHNKVVFRAAAGLVDAGLTTLKFNFRGVGSSTGVHNEIDGGTEDVRDALTWLTTEHPSDNTVLAGFSFGSRTGMAVGRDDDRVKYLISIGTPVDKYRDYDFLVGVTKPILFIHGDNDEFCTVDSLRSLTDQIPQAEVVIFKNSGHFFDDHLNDLRETVAEWTARNIQTG